MKKQAIILIAVLLLLLGLGLVLWRKTWHGTQPTVQGPASELATQRAAGLPANPTAPQEPQPIDKLTPGEQRREVINTWERAREKAVEFWGKVIDQHGEPVAGVVVTATVTSHQIALPGTPLHQLIVHSATTDANGLFYIKGSPGRGFTIETMKKQGYVLNPELQKRTDNLYWYNYDQLEPKGFKPDANAPVVFRMWKIGASELLIMQEADTRIPYDGTVVGYDLLTGRKSISGGDIRVSLVRNPQKVQWGQRNFEWTATIEAVDGGLIVSNDEFMYLAPESGYQPKLVIHMSADDPLWTDEKNVAFYLKSRGGKNYGHVKLEFMTGSDKPTTGFSFHSSINPNGSRNLEYDPAAQTQNLFPSRLHPQADSTAPKP